MNRYRQILESATEFAVIVTDREGVVTEWNTGAERIFGWRAAAVVGRSASLISTPEDRAGNRMAKEMSDAVTRGRGVDERWHMKADGTRFWASGEMMPLRDEAGAHVGFVKILRDRTDRHLHGIRLEELQTQLSQAQEAGGIGLFTVDVASGMLTATPEFSRLYGLDHVDCRPASEVEATIVPEDRAMASTDASRQGGTTDDDVVYRVRRPDTGEIRWIARKAQLRFDTNGRPVRYSGTSRDVTRQVATEANSAAGERRWRALSEISQTLLGLADTDEMAAAAAAIVGRTLGVGRVGYGSIDVDGETFTVASDWTRDGFSSLAGTRRLDDYGPHAEDLREGRTVVVADTRLDPRASAGLGPPGRVAARALIDHPVVENGRTVAALSVGDAAPRDWSRDEVAFVIDAAARIRATIERRRAETMLRESDERQRLALAIGEVGIFDLDLGTGELVWDDRVRAAFGVRAGRSVGQDEKLSAVHPSDRLAFDEAFREAMAGGLFDLVFRAAGLDDGVLRSVAMQGRVVEGAGGGRNFIGAVRDVSERVAAEARRDVLNAELSHRLKNTLALASSIVTQTLRTAPDVAAARKTLTDRIQALSKAHDVLMTGERDAAPLREVVRAATSLHDGEGRVRISGPEVALGPKASLTLSLIVHELSTNAAKYGALSVPDGHVEVAWTIAADPLARRSSLDWEWREVGGPPVVPPTRRSFGTRLIEMGLSGAVESRSELTYPPDGVRCRIVASLAELQESETIGG